MKKENNEKNNKLIYAIICIFIIMVLILGGYIIFDKISENSNDSQNQKENSITNNDNVDMDIVIDNATVSKDSVNSKISITGTINLSYDETKYAGVYLTGYCLGSNDEKYMIHGPGNGSTLFHNGENVLYLSETIPQNVEYPDGKTTEWKEVDWTNVKIKYCKIEKMGTAGLNDNSTNTEKPLNIEKYFN